MTTLQPKPNTTIAYTDGACKGNPGAGGWGAYLIFADGSTQTLYAGEANTTNNRMEMMATIQAIIYAFQHNPNDALEIWTDSSYVKKGITEWVDGWKKKGWKTASKKPVKNQDLWQQLDALNQSANINWNWIKGHAGHEGNEKADELANQGVIEPSGNLTKALAKSTTVVANDQSTNQSINQSTNQSAHQQITNVPKTPGTSNASNHSLTDSSSNDDWLEADILGFDSPLDMNEDEDNEDMDIPQVEHPCHPIEQSMDTNSQAVSKENDQMNNPVEDIPEFDGDTSRANPYFRPLLPKPINQGRHNRQLIMDTETTGFEFNNGDRIIEVGIVEMVGRKFTGEKLHVYINPNRTEPMSEETIRVHGITDEFLADKPTFDKVAQQVYDFMIGAEVIAHNATFDMNFLNMEFGRVGLADFASKVTVTDSLAIAKHQYPGQRNSLDALVRRLNVGKQDRTFHGALLDSEILAEVYLAMTGGQVSLAIDEDSGADGEVQHAQFNELAAMLVADQHTNDSNHQQWLDTISKKFPEVNTVWSVTEPTAPETTPADENAGNLSLF